MKKYNCTICGAGCYSADETKTICAECETDGNLVEVVRCKDCVHCHEVILTHWCTWWEDVTELNGYCSYGERRAEYRLSNLTGGKMDREALLEEALLDMLVQFSSYNNEMRHSFMSVEEYGYDLLDIEYGEPISEVYARFSEKWAKQSNTI